MPPPYPQYGFHYCIETPSRTRTPIYCAQKVTDNKSTVQPVPPGKKISPLARFGDALERHHALVACIQWMIVLLYGLLLLVPFVSPSNDTSRVARLMFWGIGWPVIVLSVMLSGRFWCGIFCPDGTLTEFASRHGKKRSIPRWIRWKGWPCTMLALTTLYGQATGFQNHFHATLVLLGIPTTLALAIGYLYGNGKRIWCMYLCPVNGLFGMLAKQSPIHFHVDKEQWAKFDGTLKRINCAPLINIRQMQSASACHACGRCSSYRNAVRLAARHPAQEILSANGHSIENADMCLLLWCMAGICTLSLAWPDSFWHRLYMETILSTGLPLDTVLPVWLAESPAALYRLFLIAAGGTLLGAILYGILRLAGRLANLRSWKPLALCLVPLIGWSLFSGICHTGFSVWQEYGLDGIWYRTFEWCILGFASACSLWLGMKTILPNRAPARLASLTLYGLSVLLLNLVWLA